MSQKSNETINPIQQGVPGIAALLKGCNFSNCDVTFSSVSTEESKGKQASSSYQATELKEVISVKEFFSD